MQMHQRAESEREASPPEGVREQARAQRQAGAPRADRRPLGAWETLLGAMAGSRVGARGHNDARGRAHELARSIRHAHSETFAGARLVPALLSRTQAWRASGLTLVFRDEAGVVHTYSGSAALKPVEITRLGEDHYQIPQGGQGRELGSKEGDGFYRALFAALLDPVFNDASQVLYGGHDPLTWKEAAQYFRELVAQHVDAHGLDDVPGVEQAFRDEEESDFPDGESVSSDAEFFSADDASVSSDEESGVHRNDPDTYSDAWKRSGAGFRANWRAWEEGDTTPGITPLTIHNAWDVVPVFLYSFGLLKEPEEPVRAHLPRANETPAWQNNDEPLTVQPVQARNETVLPPTPGEPRDAPPQQPEPLTSAGHENIPLVPLTQAATTTTVTVVLAATSAGR